MEIKQEIQEMFFILLCSVVIGGITLFYLQRKFVFSTLQSELEQIKIKKRNLLREIDLIKLQKAKYSSIHRINQLLPEEIDAKDFISQEIFTLKIPPTRSYPTEVDKKNQIVQYEYSP